MKELSRRIVSILFAVLCVCGLESCYDYGADNEISGTDKGTITDKMLLVLHVSPIDTRSQSSFADMKEKIKSLRIIVLGSDTVECSRKATFTSTSPATSNNFNYIFTWSTVPGEKEIYLIANEESVSKIEYTSKESLPSDLPITLSELLKRYESPSTDADEFRKVMESVYFSPEYTSDEAGNIFLPYTSYYKLSANGKELLEQDVFLVPVATKFTFKFVNHRTYPVEVGSISVAQTNTCNFLFANMDNSEIEMTFADDGKSYYWIDWLAKVAEMSHNNSSSVGANETFNNRYGWIKAYKMPNTDAIVSEFLKPENLKTVPAVTTSGEEGKEGYTEEPGKLELGPFYVSESRWEETYKDVGGNDVTEQIYRLTLGLIDQKPDATAPEFEDVVISNLKALFRNTSVVITITMAEGDIKIYAEIQDWNHKYANGWVTDQ